jgi:hypothetical protein
MGSFCTVAKQPQNGSNGVFAYLPGHIGLVSCKKMGQACMFSCMHAFWLNQIGKLSFREAYHDHENHDYDHKTDLKTFHTVRVHSRDHHRHFTVAKNGPKRPTMA